MHAFANPARFLRIARPLTAISGWLGVCLLFIGLTGGLFLSPPEALQGETVRIMYVHVPAAWLGVGGWTGLVLAAIMQLVWRHPLAGVAGRATAVPGAVFTAICLITGSIWGRPAWGTWWQWDGRLTSMLVLFFLYIAYLALAEAGEERPGVSRATAIFAIIGAVNLPIIKYSVEWWWTMHQKASITISGSAMAPEFLWPLMISAAGFTLIFVAIVLMRMRALLGRARIEMRLARLARG